MRNWLCNRTFRCLLLLLFCLSALRIGGRCIFCALLAGLELLLVVQLRRSVRCCGSFLPLFLGYRLRFGAELEWHFRDDDDVVLSFVVEIIKCALA